MAGAARAEGDAAANHVSADDTADDAGDDSANTYDGDWNV